MNIRSTVNANKTSNRSILKCDMCSSLRRRTFLRSVSTTSAVYQLEIKFYYLRDGEASGLTAGGADVGQCGVRPAMARPGPARQALSYPRDTADSITRHLVRFRLEFPPPPPPPPTTRLSSPRCRRSSSQMSTNEPTRSNFSRVQLNSPTTKTVVGHRLLLAAASSNQAQCRRTPNT